MISLESVLLLAHLFGLALGVGCATAKVSLLYKSRANLAFLPVFIAVTRPITRFIIIGQILLTLSGIGWLILGQPFTTLLAIKLVLFAAVWVIGPTIDNVIEPKFVKLAPAAGESPSPEFLQIQKRYLIMDSLATGIYYVIILMWVLF